MSLKEIFPASFLAGLMTLSLLLCCGGSAAQAGPPDWEEGDAWAAGFDMDLGAEFAEQITGIEEMLQNTADMELDDFDVDGSASFWIVFEITEVTAENYVLSAEMAQRLMISADVQVTGDLPAEGTYSGTEQMEMEQKTISLEAMVDYALVVSGEMVMEKETLAIETIDLVIRCSLLSDVEMTNFPSFEYDYDQTIISYQDVDMNVELDLEIAIDIEFDPALDVFQFPFDTGDTWTVESNGTLEGTIDGVLDASGLPPEATQDLFDSEVLIENGITDFPIEFDTLVIDEDDGPQINNGIIEQISGPIEFDMACVGTTAITIPDYGDVQAYILEVNDEWRFFYSGEMEFLTSMEMDIDDVMEEMEIEIPFDIPEEFMNPSEDMSMEMGSADPDVAKGGIDDIIEYQEGISEEANSEANGGDESLNDFFFMSPYFGFIIVALVIVIVVAAVYAGVRRG